jgi:hypothetical protein
MKIYVCVQINIDAPKVLSAYSSFEAASEAAKNYEDTFTQDRRLRAILGPRSGSPRNGIKE